MTPNSADGSLLGKIAGYVDILAKDPRSSAFVPLAEAYRQMGLLDEALVVATRGVKAQPAFSPGYTVLGRIENQLGKPDAAASAFERALLIDPENLVSLKGLARIRMQQGEMAFALKLLQRAVKLKPDDEAAKKMLISLESGINSPVPRQLQEPSAPVQPPSAPVQPPAAPVQPAAAPQPAPHQAEPISTATIAEIYIRQGFLNKALKVYRDMLQADPHNDEVRGKLIELKQRIESDRVLQTPTSPSVSAANVIAENAAANDPMLAETAGPGNTTERQVAVLTAWLDSISRRRADVQ